MFRIHLKNTSKNAAGTCIRITTALLVRGAVGARRCTEVYRCRLTEARRSTDAYLCLQLTARSWTYHRALFPLAYRAVEIRRPPLPFSEGAGNLSRPRESSKCGSTALSSSSSDSALARKNSSTRSSGLREISRNPLRLSTLPSLALVTNLEEVIGASSGDGYGGGSLLRLLDRRRLPPLPAPSGVWPRVVETAPLTSADPKNAFILVDGRNAAPPSLPGN